MQHTAAGYHECVVPNSRVLEHRGENCYDACDKKSGLCAWCGEGNACCRHDRSGPEECDNVLHSVYDQHECVIPVDQVKVGFADFMDLPGMGYISSLVQGCNRYTEKPKRKASNSTEDASDQGTCPGQVLSMMLRVSLSKSAGVIGWTLAVLELLLQNPPLARVALALPVFISGAALTFYGYGLMGITWFYQGFLAGCVISAVGLSVASMKLGVCRGQYIETCEVQSLARVVLLSGVAFGFLSWWLRRIQEVMYGGNLGATVAAVFYLYHFRHEIHVGMFAADKSERLLQGLGVATAIGWIVTAIITNWVRKPLWVIGTSIVGGLLMVASENIAVGESVDEYDGYGMAAIAVFGMLIQYCLFLRHEAKILTQVAAETASRGLEVPKAEAEEQSKQDDVEKQGLLASNPSSSGCLPCVG